MRARCVSMCGNGGAYVQDSPGFPPGNRVKQVMPALAPAARWREYPGIYARSAGNSCVRVSRPTSLTLAHGRLFCFALGTNLLFERDDKLICPFQLVLFNFDLEGWPLYSSVFERL